MATTIKRVQGLSPRVRGNPSGVGAVLVQIRVYPRVCGGTEVDPDFRTSS